VVVPNAIGATPRTGDARCSGFRLIVPGQPWWSQYAPKPGHPTAPTDSDRIAALEQRVGELEAQMRPTAETFEQPELSYQRAKAEQLRSEAALLLAQANLVEAGQ
jgi:hypothetical protein